MRSDRYFFNGDNLNFGTVSGATALAIQVVGITAGASCRAANSKTATCP